MKLIFDLKSDFIFVRDFFMSDKVKIKKPNVSFSENIKKYFQKLNVAKSKIKEFRGTILESWENLYGDISKTNESLMHLLLKFRYFDKSNEIVEREFFENIYL